MIESSSATAAQGPYRERDLGRMLRCAAAVALGLLTATLLNDRVGAPYAWGIRSAIVAFAYVLNVGVLLSLGAFGVLMSLLSRRDPAPGWIGHSFARHVADAGLVIGVGALLAALLAL